MSGGNDEQVSRPEPLTAAHDLAAFACGEPTLDDWLRRRAVANQRSGVSRSATAVPPVLHPLGGRHRDHRSTRPGAA